MLTPRENRSCQDDGRCRACDASMCLFAASDIDPSARAGWPVYIRTHRPLGHKRRPKLQMHAFAFPRGRRSPIADNVCKPRDCRLDCIHGPAWPSLVLPIWMNDVTSGEPRRGTSQRVVCFPAVLQPRTVDDRWSATFPIFTAIANPPTCSK